MIPYRSVPQTVLALAAGEMDVFVSPIGEAKFSTRSSATACWPLDATPTSARFSNPFGIKAFDHYPLLDKRLIKERGERPMSNIFTKLDLSTRAAATTWADEHGLI